MTECYVGIPDEVLDSTWLDSDLARLSRSVVSWEELAPFWGLTEAEEEEIKRDNHSYATQKLATLRRWKAKCSKTATYRQLVRVFARMGKLELVEKVREFSISVGAESLPHTAQKPPLSVNQVSKVYLWLAFRRVNLFLFGGLRNFG